MGMGLGPTLALGTRSIETPFGPFKVHFFRDPIQGRTMMAIARGDLAAPGALLVRVHSSCITSECLMACDCDCSEQLASALARIDAQGRGVVFYLLQEGRGAGLTAKARDRMMVQASQNRMTTFEAYAEMGLPADLRSYHGVRAMAQALEIRGPIDLMTNNPRKTEQVAAILANDKVEVRGALSIRGEISAFNRDYLRSKRLSGHDLVPAASLSSVRPPRSVKVLPPLRAADEPNLISTARYCLPVRIASLRAESGVEIRPTEAKRGEALVSWFDMRVVYDLRTTRESVLLTYLDPGRERRSAASEGVVGEREGASQSGSGEVQTLTLFDRLPGAPAVGRRRLAVVLNGIRTDGQGSVVVHFDDSALVAEGSDGTPPPTPMRVAEEILRARWLPARENAREFFDAEP